MKKRLTSAAIALAALVVVMPAMSATINARPTASAVRYWKGHAIGMALRDAWWKGYLGSRADVSFRSCHIDTRQPITYGCTLKDQYGVTTLAFVGMVRIAGCSYAAIFDAAAKPTHALTRRFRYCG